MGTYGYNRSRILSTGPQQPLVVFHQDTYDAEFTVQLKCFIVCYAEGWSDLVILFSHEQSSSILTFKLVWFISGIFYDFHVFECNIFLFPPLAAWENSFDPLRTYEDDFFVDTNASVRVNMMQRDYNYDSYYDQDLSCEVVELPYQGTARALLILPDDGKMKQVEDALSKETVCKWDSKLTNR